MPWSIKSLLTFKWTIVQISSLIKKVLPFYCDHFQIWRDTLTMLCFTEIFISQFTSVKPNLTGQPNDHPFTDSRLRFEFSWPVWVTFLEGYPMRNCTVTCSHVFIGSTTYIPENVDPPYYQYIGQYINTVPLNSPLKGPLGVSLANVSKLLPLEPISKTLTLVRVSLLRQHAPHQSTTVSAPPDTVLRW